jgi:hypothetical protein
MGWSGLLWATEKSWSFGFFDPNGLCLEPIEVCPFLGQVLMATDDDARADSEPCRVFLNIVCRADRFDGRVVNSRDENDSWALERSRAARRPKTLGFEGALEVRR